MEISALAPSSHTFSPASEARAVQVARENVRNKGSEDAAIAQETLKDAEQAPRTREDTLRAAQEAQREQAIQSNIAGTIQFDEEEGTHIMKVLDSKDVLIYQVPSKGQLSLVKAEEAAARRMLIRA
jgi:hypothetical protein